MKIFLPFFIILIKIFFLIFLAPLLGYFPIKTEIKIHGAALYFHRTYRTGNTDDIGIGILIGFPIVGK